MCKRSIIPQQRGNITSNLNPNSCTRAIHPISQLYSINSAFYEYFWQLRTNGKKKNNTKNKIISLTVLVTAPANIAIG